MDHKLTTLNQIKHLTLTDEERAYLRGRMAQVISAPIPTGEPLFQRGMQHGLRIALSSFLFVVFVGGSISAVASNALPGDPLYGAKIAFNEKIMAALRNTPEAKVAYQKSLVEKRVSEIKTLAETKTLTKEKQAKAQKALDSNIQDLSTQLSALSDESPNSALSVTAHLEENLKANKEAIQSTFEAGAQSPQDAAAVTASIQTIDGTLKKVSQQEVKILSKEIDNITGEVNATSTDATPGIELETNTTTKGSVLGASATATTTSPQKPITPVSP